jgi:hypothetical protein
VLEDHRHQASPKNVQTSHGRCLACRPTVGPCTSCRPPQCLAGAVDCRLCVLCVQVLHLGK